MEALASKWCPWGNATEKLSYWHYWLLKRLADGIGSPVPFPPSKRPRPWGRLLGASWIRWRQVSQVSQVSHHVIQDRSRSWGDPGRTKNPSEVLLQPNYAKLRILWISVQFIWFQLKFQLWFQLFPSEKFPNQGRTTRSSCGLGSGDWNRRCTSSSDCQGPLPEVDRDPRSKWSVYGPFPSLKHGL